MALGLLRGFCIAGEADAKQERFEGNRKATSSGVGIKVSMGTSVDAKQRAKLRVYEACSSLVVA
jgi:hypothetical protein